MPGVFPEEGRGRGGGIPCCRPSVAEAWPVPSGLHWLRPHGGWGGQGIWAWMATVLPDLALAERSHCAPDHEGPAKTAGMLQPVRFRGRERVAGKGHLAGGWGLNSRKQAGRCWLVRAFWWDLAEAQNAGSGTGCSRVWENSAPALLVVSRRKTDSETVRKRCAAAGASHYRLAVAGGGSRLAGKGRCCIGFSGWSRSPWSGLPVGQVWSVSPWARGDGSIQRSRKADRTWAPPEARHRLGRQPAPAQPCRAKASQV